MKVFLGLKVLGDRLSRMRVFQSGYVLESSELIRIWIFSPLSNKHSNNASINHLVIRQFVSRSPRYHLAIKGVREQFMVLETVE